MSVPSLSSVMSMRKVTNGTNTTWKVLRAPPGDAWLEGMGIPPIDPGHVVTMLYLKISISDFLTLFSSRTQEKWFFAFPPSKILMIGAMISLTISTLVATFWADSSPDNIRTTGLYYAPEWYTGDAEKYHLLPLWVWFYCIFWWFLQDVAKVLTFKFMEHHDLFQYRTIAEGKYQPQATTKGERRRSRGMSLGATDSANEPLISRGETYGSIQHKH